MTEERTIRLRWGHTIQGVAPIANALLLIGFLSWLLIANQARNGIAEIEALLRFEQATEPMHGRPFFGSMLTFCFAGLFTFLAMLVGLFFGRRESRSLRAWLTFWFLVCGWLGAWLGRHDVYWFGHGVRVAAEVSAAAKLANALDAKWPDGDGDYPELGVVLGYPKKDPDTLILAGEPIVVGNLRVVAVEKSVDGETLRFQLANPNNDTWLVRSRNGKQPSEFVNGFKTRYTTIKVQALSQDWYLVRYAEP